MATLRHRFHSAQPSARYVVVTRAQSRRLEILHGREDGIPEFFASRIERCEDNGNGTCRLWFVADRVSEDVGARRVTEAVASVVMPTSRIRTCAGRETITAQAREREIISDRVALAMKREAEEDCGKHKAK
jgi:hypothetical protein